MAQKTIFVTYFLHITTVTMDCIYRVGKSDLSFTSKDKKKKHVQSGVAPSEGVPSLSSSFGYTPPS